MIKYHSNFSNYLVKIIQVLSQRKDQKQFLKIVLVDGQKVILHDNISCNTLAAFIQKHEETSPI